MRFLRFLGWALAASLTVRAAEPLNLPVPFASPPAASAGSNAITGLAAKQAQQMGLPTIAAALYRQLLSLPGADRQALTLDLATALLDDRRPAEASEILFGLSSGHNAAWHLREALAQADLGNLSLVEHELTALRPNELSAEDHAWYLFLEGRLAAAQGDRQRAEGLFRQAADSAPTELARARFVLARENDRLLLGQVTEQGTREMLDSAIRFQGTPTGYDAERSYAAMLNARGRRSEAVAALQSDLLTLPAPERARADDFRLLLGLVAGAADGEGRAALRQLLETGSDPDRQRMALQLLANASGSEPALSQFRTELDKLLGGAHPILADLLLFRAQWALRDQDYAVAAEDAQALLDRFPGSSVKSYALAVLASAAWDEHRYRTAAEFARQAGTAFGPSEQGALMAVLVAEALFRAGAQAGGGDDFRGAAEAYAAALAAPPPNVPVGELMFQRIESEIRAGALARAGSIIDEFARNPAFDNGDRWQAEYNLVRALQLHGDVAPARARLDRLLSGPPQGQPADPSLQARMAWLRAQISFDAGEFAQTLRLTADLLAALGGLAPELRAEISGTARLLRAQAYFELRQEPDAKAALAQLRAEAPGSEAAVKSYLIEAEHYAQQDEIVEAQQILRKLADDFPKSPDAPYALLQSAYLAERLGQDQDLKEAGGLLNELITKYPESDLVFDAYLKEGDVLRERNQFPLAEEAYKHLTDHYSPQSPDVILAKLALADCDVAQATADSGHEERALSLYEELLDRADASADVRVEAGYKLGKILVQRRLVGEAETRWFRDVVRAFLLDPQQAAELGPKGREWMTRTLLDLGDLLKDDGKPDQAQTTWRLILDKKLPAAHLAQAKLDELASGGPRP
jgi:outer membrane protein assembly factor BamD (BamD/ComL family)